MTRLDVAVVIPARYASSRFPGKPLADIAGVPMIVRVLRNVADARTVGRVLVATDDERIAAVVRGAGGTAVMTDPDLPSGSDRVWAAAAGLGCDVVVNVQGDEPLLPGSVLDQLVAVLEADADVDIATPVVRCARAHAGNDDVVTVARDESGRAWYFSRSVIPAGADPVWRHVGVYAYRVDALRRFVAAPPAALERTERLEQLRALTLGLHLAAVPVEVTTCAVDRPVDVGAVERVLAGLPAAPPIRLVVLDVDGVLTDGGIAYEGDAGQVVRFDVKDGYGIVALVRAGIGVAVLSARDSRALRRRADELGIEHVRTGVADKGAGLRALCADVGVAPEEVCYVGDDDPDLAAMAIAGLAAAPADASPAVRRAAGVLLSRPGGRGAVRELADLLLAGGHTGTGTGAGG
ncbi:MAG: 3-deoxy-manno-octulosonate cytidylyltransferase synthetase [Actinomycetota bacterium]|nr:3-deoxy-manno-octulosonate cytidylyltransferase synthetase [Actinomycetota bacterium]